MVTNKRDEHKIARALARTGTQAAVPHHYHPSGVKDPSVIAALEGYIGQKTPLNDGKGFVISNEEPALSVIEWEKSILPLKYAWIPPPSACAS